MPSVEPGLDRWQQARTLLRDMRVYLQSARHLAQGLVRVHLEQMIVRQGFQVLFPVNINPGHILAHRTVAPTDPQPLGARDYTTIDIGFFDRQVMVDTAITLVTPASQGVLQDYRGRLRSIVTQLGRRYQLRGTLGTYQICRLVQDTMSPEYTIVQECCSHQMRVATGQLHATSIPMGNKKYPLRADVRYGPGAKITLQPHVVLTGKPYRIRYSPGNIWLNPAGRRVYVPQKSSQNYPQIQVVQRYGWYQQINLHLDYRQGRYTWTTLGLSDRTVS